MTHDAVTFHEGRRAMMNHAVTFNQGRLAMMREKVTFHEWIRTMMREAVTFNEWRRTMMRETVTFHEWIRTMMRETVTFNEGRRAMMRETVTFHGGRRAMINTTDCCPKPAPLTSSDLQVQPAYFSSKSSSVFRGRRRKCIYLQSTFLVKHCNNQQLSCVHFTYCILNRMKNMSNKFNEII